MQQQTETKMGLTRKILIAMTLGIIVGLVLHAIPPSKYLDTFVINGILDAVGKIFINILKMLVVPIVFVSLVTGICNLGDSKKFGQLAAKTILFYLFTTALAITLALTIASIMQVGAHSNLVAPNNFSTQALPSLKETFINIFPSNPVSAMASGNMLQIIVFSVLLGLAITLSGKAGEHIADFFKSFNVVILNLTKIVINVAPYGVFCLIAAMLAKLGLDLIWQLIGYFITVLIVLFVHLFLSYPLLLRFIGGLNPLPFYRKMFSAMVFAFSTASSNAALPVVLNTVETKLGVKNRIAAFIIPLGATVNMDGTAIMQGVATVFIANAYNIDIGLIGYLLVVLTATLASIGTAGIPSVGLITLTMVLQQVGLPVEGIALIIGVDRLLDMVRTAVNITGDSAISCIVAKSEQAIDLTTYNKQHP